MVSIFRSARKQLIKEQTTNPTQNKCKVAVRNLEKHKPAHIFALYGYFYFKIDNEVKIYNLVYSPMIYPAMYILKSSNSS